MLQVSLEGLALSSVLTYAADRETGKLKDELQDFAELIFYLSESLDKPALGVMWGARKTS
ncbi:MAG: hypothetical protein R2865_15255 [Deinococcales bacterium]